MKTGIAGRAHALLGVVIATGLGGCSSVDVADRKLSNASTLEAQTELARDAPQPRKRVRYLGRAPARREPFRASYPPYDHSRTPEDQAAADYRAEVAANIAKSDWETMAPEGKMRLIYTDERSDEWEEEYDLEDLRELMDFAQSRGINRPSEPEDGTKPSVKDSVEPPNLQPQGWGSGNDTRDYKPINATYPVNHDSLMRQGQISSGCTASLVGRRLILTAAHCAVSPTNTVTHPFTYWARRDGATLPWGAQETEANWRASEYGTNSCHTTYTPSTRETCGKYDWILMRLKSTAWAGGTPSWMGYWLPAEGGWYSRLDGYPACGLPESPANCVDNSVYGRHTGRSLFNFRGHISGEATIFNSANDMSPGHSGGPVWSSSYPDSSGPYVLGIVTNQMCGTCGVGTPADDREYPAMHHKMTSWLAGIITDKRALYP